MSDLDLFLIERPRLHRLAYRMMGSVSEAEDILQDVWMRWTQALDVQSPAAWLTRAVSNLCLDRLKSARQRRETYVGPWLPEPLIEEYSTDPLERAEDISIAFLLALERLSPLERAVFLLHEVFDEDYAAIAQCLDRTETACRQLAARARHHVQQSRSRTVLPPARIQQLASAFMAAAQGNDLSLLRDLLAEDAILLSDAGGKRPAALRPMVGRDDVIRLLQGLAWRGKSLESILSVRVARVNGQPGMILTHPDGPSVLTLEVGEDGLISALYIFRNPDKLGHVGG